MSSLWGHGAKVTGESHSRKDIVLGYIYAPTCIPIIFNTIEAKYFYYSEPATIFTTASSEGKSICLRGYTGKNRKHAIYKSEKIFSKTY